MISTFGRGRPAKSFKSMRKAYSTEIIWRIFYIIFASCVCIIQAWVDGSDVLRDLMLEPWFRLWGGETRFYSEPNELWHVELILSIVVGFWFVFPIIGGHIIQFMCNSLRTHELNSYLKIWLCRSVLMFSTWFVLIELEGVGMLMDLSHGDNEGAESMVYVPTLGKYRNAWVMLMLLMGLSSQLPLLWMISVPKLLGKYLPEKAHNEKEPWSVILTHERTKFFSVFVIPVLISALLLIDEPRTACFWRLRLWFVYLCITRIMVIIQVAKWSILLNHWVLKD